MSTATQYVLGTDPAELARLGFQHRLWADLAHSSWRHADIAPGHRVLDVGAGPGFAALDIAQIVGSTGQVVAIDESQDFLDSLAQQAAARGASNIVSHRGDVQRLTHLPLTPASFDVAYARWVLCFVPDPAAVLAGVARLLKPGGRFVINDYFNYESMTIAPKNPAFTRGIHAVGRSWRDRGGDPDIVSRIPALAARAGLTTVHLQVHQRLAKPSDTMWHWPDSFWRNYAPKLVTSGHLSQQEYDAFMAAWDAAAADPHAFMLLPPVFEVILKRD
jgi:SAM-dependent methyltransferase